MEDFIKDGSVEVFDRRGMEFMLYGKYNIQQINAYNKILNEEKEEFIKNFLCDGRID